MPLAAATPVPRRVLLVSMPPMDTSPLPSLTTALSCTCTRSLPRRRRPCCASTVSWRSTGSQTSNVSWLSREALDTTRQCLLMTTCGTTPWCQSTTRATASSMWTEWRKTWKFMLGRILQTPLLTAREPQLGTFSTPQSMRTSVTAPRGGPWTLLMEAAAPSAWEQPAMTEPLQLLMESLTRLQCGTGGLTLTKWRARSSTCLRVCRAEGWRLLGATKSISPLGGHCIRDSTIRAQRAHQLRARWPMRQAGLQGMT